MSDPTDPGGVGAAQGDRGRSSARLGDGASPLTIALALIALVGGFLIFRAIDDGQASGSQQPTQTVAQGATATTVAGGQQPGGSTTTAAPAASPAQNRVTEGATVLVANDSGVNGAAGTLTGQLAELGYSTEEPTDAPDPNSDITTVYFSAGPPAIQEVAQSVARDLGGKEVKPMPTPIPTQSGNAGAANVIVELGDDLAGKSLSDITPAAVNVTAPPPAAGGATPTTAG